MTLSDPNFEKINIPVYDLDPLSKEFFKLSLKETAFKIITE